MMTSYATPIIVLNYWFPHKFFKVIHSPIFSFQTFYLFFEMINGCVCNT